MSPGLMAMINCIIIWLGVVNDHIKFPLGDISFRCPLKMKNPL
jgi:hypothetical protein